MRQSGLAEASQLGSVTAARAPQLGVTGVRSVSGQYSDTSALEGGNHSFLQVNLNHVTINPSAEGQEENRGIPRAHLRG